MGVGVEKAVLYHHFYDKAGGVRGNPVTVVAGGIQGFDVADLYARDALQHHDIAPQIRCMPQRSIRLPPASSTVMNSVVFGSSA